MTHVRINLSDNYHPPHPFKVPHIEITPEIARAIINIASPFYREGDDKPAPCFVCEQPATTTEAEKRRWLALARDEIDAAHRERDEARKELAQAAIEAEKHLGERAKGLFAFDAVRLLAEGRDEARAQLKRAVELLRPMANGLRQFAANGIHNDPNHRAWRIQAEHFAEKTDTFLKEMEAKS